MTKRWTIEDSIREIRALEEWDREQERLKNAPTQVGIHPADTDEGRAQIERVAMALHAAEGFPGSTTGRTKSRYRSMARAALDALREG